LEIFVIKTSRGAAPGPYHHGNLGPALVEAALALLDETQCWAFSLREVVRRAGVSHNAPYKHFPEKRDLLAAVAASGFEALAERTLSSLEGLTNAWARLLACGQAFVAHGIANPALYPLMFSAVLTSFDAGRPPIDATAGQVKPWARRIGSHWGHHTVCTKSYSKPKNEESQSFRKPEYSLPASASADETLGIPRVQTIAISQPMALLISKLRWRTILDKPCGDPDFHSARSASSFALCSASCLSKVNLRSRDRVQTLGAPCACSDPCWSDLCFAAVAARTSLSPSGYRPRMPWVFPSLGRIAVRMSFAEGVARLVTAPRMSWQGA
jgi:hypothetical protein